MTRVSQNQLVSGMLRRLEINRDNWNKYSEQATSGIRVSLPGDSNRAATIADYQQVLQRVESYKTQVADVRGSLNTQDGVLGQASELLIKGKELATQGANESYSTEERRTQAVGVFQLRDQLVTLANTRYQGRYVYGAADDDDPPFDPATYTTPATGVASQRYIFDAEAGTSTTRSVDVTDDVAVVANTSGTGVFSNAISALERLGRALMGYTTLPAVGQPDGTGAAYTLPDERTLQTTAINETITLLDTARAGDVQSEITSVAGRLRQLDYADAVLEATKIDATTLTSQLQDIDVSEAATLLAQSKDALEASYIVSNKVMNLSILDYL